MRLTCRFREGRGCTNRYNAVLKRVLGNKGRAEMTLSELEAALAWLERNRLADFLHLPEGDARYAWEARQRSAWRPRLRSIAVRGWRTRAAQPEPWP
jgi:hypothetical protein